MESIINIFILVTLILIIIFMTLEILQHKMLKRMADKIKRELDALEKEQIKEIDKRLNKRNPC